MLTRCRSRGSPTNPSTCACWNSGCAAINPKSCLTTRALRSSSCANQVLAVTDSVNGKSIARAVIGRGPDGVAFDADLGLVFSSNGIDGTLTVIHQDTPDDYRVTATVTTQVSARTMALDPVTHKIYLAAAQFGPTPAPTADQPNPRAPLLPDSFVVLVAQPR